MKKIFVFAVLLIALCAVQPVFSQAWLVGGSLRFEYSSTDPGTSSSSTTVAPLEFSLRPLALYELSGMLDVGATLGIDWEEDTSTAFTVGPIVRFKFMTLDRVMVYARGSLTYSITSYEQSGKDSDNTIALSAALGGDIEITDNILFFLELGFVDYEHFWIEDYNTDTFTIAFTTPSPSIGILFRF